MFPVLAYLWLVGSVGASIKVTSQPPPPLNLRLPTAACEKASPRPSLSFTFIDGGGTCPQCHCLPSSSADVPQAVFFLPGVAAIKHLYSSSARSDERNHLTTAHDDNDDDDDDTVRRVSRPMLQVALPAAYSSPAAAIHLSRCVF